MHSKADVNFCRSFDGDKKREYPWCYVGDNDWEYCDVPFCKRKLATLSIGIGLNVSGYINIYRHESFVMCPSVNVRWKPYL